MKRRRAGHGKRIIAATLAMMLAVQPFSGAWGVSTVNAAGTTDAISAFSLENDGTGIDIEKSRTDLYVGSDWAGTGATVTESGSKATFDVSSYGWNGEWGLQYKIYDLDVKDNTEYTLEFDILSSIDKKIFLKFGGGDNPLISDTIELKADTPYHYKQSTAGGVFTKDDSDDMDSNGKKIVFGLGQMAGEAANQSGTLEIANIKVTEHEVAQEIAVNKTGTKVTFQQEADDAIDSATVFYQIFDSEAEANAADVGTFPGYPMTKKASGIWEYSNDAIELQSGQVIRYRFNVIRSGAGALSEAKNHVFTRFIAKDYTVDTKDRTSEGYTLVWNDEFDGTELDMSKWSFQIGTKDPNGGPDNWGNEELEYYTDKNHEVKDGKLVITAKKEEMEGMPYTSTRIRTITDDGETLYAPRYGRVEARMKLPAEDGLWPAFWMLPEDTTIYGTWAASGEIDIMEARGREPGKVDGTLHFGSQWPNNSSAGKNYYFDTDETDISGYHLYSLEWEPGKITWLVDDVPYGSISNFYSKGADNAANYAYGAPFDVPFYIILNLAVGGTYDGDANLNNATFPASMEVDYVRVYQKTEGYDEENLVEPDLDKDFESFNSAEFQPAGSDGDYVGDTQFATLKDVAEVNPDDSDWQFFVGDFGGAATQTIDTIDGTKYAKIDISSSGGQNYAIQLIKHFPFAEGYTYEISFDAKSSGSRNILVKPCGDGDNSWAGYGQSYEAALTTEMKHYTHQFTMDKTSDPTARLEFDLGLSTNSVWIGNVVVKMVEKGAVDNTDMAKTPLANGNQIYNGTFDQGTDRVGFWHFNNVTAYVPSLVGEHDYSRRAILTATGADAKIYQKGMELLQSDQYQFTMDLSSENDTNFQVMFTSADGSNIYMKESFSYKAADGIKEYTSNFAMPKGVTDKDGVFVLSLADGSVVSVDNINLVRMTKNNVSMDYSKVELEPIKTNSTEWTGHDQDGGDPGFTNNNGELSIETANATINYQRMLFHPVTLQEGITYKLSFKAKSDKGETYEMSVQEDNSWAEVIHETIETTTSWKDYEYTFTSTLTNAGNPINLKYLLSGANVSQGKFYLKDVSMTVVVETGGKEAPEKTATGSAKIAAGTDYTIQVAEGEWKNSFMETVAANGKAVIMINEMPLNDYVKLADIVKADAGTITIPGAYLNEGGKNYRIELALSGYNNVVLNVTTTGTSGSNDSQLSGNVKVDVDSQTGAPGASIVTPIETLLTIIPLTEQEKEDIRNGSILSLRLKMADITNTISQEEKDLIAAELKKSLPGYIIGKYLDLTLQKDLNGEVTILSELNGMMRIEIQVPEDCKNTDASVKREFAVIRVHNGETTVLKDLDDNDDTITIETDCFSTYAIAYKDSAAAANGTSNEASNGTSNGIGANKVKTGDNAPIANMILLVSCAAVAMAAAGRKKFKYQSR